MKKFLHWVLIMFGVAAWTVGNIGYALATAFTIAADKMMPNAETGNCWSYALPKWSKHGGYLLVRAADSIRFMNFFWVPHVLWVEKLPTRGVTLTQFVPNERTPEQIKTRWWPWFTTYYRGTVRGVEAQHPAKSVVQSAKEK